MSIINFIIVLLWNIFYYFEFSSKFYKSLWIFDYKNNSYGNKKHFISLCISLYIFNLWGLLNLVIPILKHFHII